MSGPWKATRTNKLRVIDQSPDSRCWIDHRTRCCWRPRGSRPRKRGTLHGLALTAFPAGSRRSRCSHPQPVAVLETGGNHRSGSGRREYPSSIGFAGLSRLRSMVLARSSVRCSVPGATAYLTATCAKIRRDRRRLGNRGGPRHSAEARRISLEPGGPAPEAFTWS
jgi:hypothetical protein